jgi:hypothetical protein
MVLAFLIYTLNGLNLNFWPDELLLPPSENSV